MWIGIPQGAAINAFATGTIARLHGANNGVPGNVASDWTLFQLSPLPQLNPAAFMLVPGGLPVQLVIVIDRKSTRLNSSHLGISYAVFCLKKKKLQVTPQ